METLSEYVKRIMQEKQLTAVDIEVRSGNKIADSHIANILKGKTKNLTIEKVNALAEGLGVDSIEVFSVASGRTVKQHKAEPWPANVLVRTLEKIIASPDLTRAVQILTKAKPGKVKAFLKYLEKENE